MTNSVEIKRAFTKTPKEPRELLTPEEAKSCKSMAEAIRLCSTKTTDRGEIARFLGIKYQWVRNVLTQELKRK